MKHKTNTCDVEAALKILQCSPHEKHFFRTSFSTEMRVLVLAIDILRRDTRNSAAKIAIKLKSSERTSETRDTIVAIFVHA